MAASVHTAGEKRRAPDAGHSAGRLKQILRSRRVFQFDKHLIFIVDTLLPLFARHAYKHGRVTKVHTRTPEENGAARSETGSTMIRYPGFR